MIYLYMRVRDVWEGSGKHIILKCLVNLGVSSLRPPPGGLQAHTKAVFSINFQNLSFLSQTPFLSIIVLSTSTAGMAPNYSCAGMLVSSIATIQYVPLAAPSIFFLNLSSFDSTESWSWKWEVVEVRTRGACVILLSWILLPVPEGPVTRMGLVFLERRLMIEE